MTFGICLLCGHGEPPELPRHLCAQGDGLCVNCCYDKREPKCENCDGYMGFLELFFGPRPIATYDQKEMDEIIRILKGGGG